MKEKPHAVHVEVLSESLDELSVIRLESHPPQFLLRGMRTMPTPGWLLRVDRVEEELDARGVRIAAYVTEVPPQDIVPQVLTPTELRVPLGVVPPGRHLLALLGRRGEEAPYALFAAFVVEARGPEPVA